METVIKSIWAKSKLLIKGFIIAMLAIILQIPSTYVRGLIEERENRQKEATSEVSSKWAGEQIVTGPVIILPYLDNTSSTPNSPAKKNFAYFLPDELKLKSVVKPQEKYRGIYKVSLYTASVGMTGSFNDINLDRLNIKPENVLWNEAAVRIIVSDPKGLNDEIRLQWNDELLGLSNEYSKDGMEAPLKVTRPEDIHHVIFSTEINLNGSSALMFCPVGKSTSATLSSTWPNPSFTGNILPMQSQVNDNGFSAAWKSLSHKRNFPQQWKTEEQSTNADNSVFSNIRSAAFGVDLFIPVNGYQKTLRSIKYAALCILLTFISFFLIETNNKRSVHPFQYGLIGLALILFYTLLLSFSEYVGFDVSYLIASVATIGLIAWFAKSILSSAKLGALLAVVLVLLYTYVFSILQLQDYSLLFGSIGLFLTLAVIMYYSRKIQW